MIDFQISFQIHNTIGLVQFIGLCLAFFVPRRFIYSVVIPHIRIVLLATKVENIWYFQKFAFSLCCVSQYKGTHNNTKDEPENRTYFSDTTYFAIILYHGFSAADHVWPTFAPSISTLQWPVRER